MRSPMKTSGRPRAARAAVLALVGVAALGLAGCGSASAPGADPTAGATPSTTAITLRDGWVKAVEDLEHPMSATKGPTDGAGASREEMSAPMSAMFGTLTNDTDADVTVTAGSTPVAGMVQLHETVRATDGRMQMQEKKGGFVVPAHGSLELAPGGNHVMLMDLGRPLRNGDTVTMTFETSAGPVTLDVPIRTFTGANETYDPSPTS